MLRPAFCCLLSTMMSVLLPFEALCAPVEPALGGITGVVRDERGAVVPAARITLMRQGSQRQELVRSGADGQFILQPLPEGDYIVTVAKAGFAPLRLQRVVVKPGQSTEIQPVLSTSDLTSDLRRELLLIPAGKKIEVKLKQEGSKKITGKLGPVTDDGFEVQTGKSGQVSSDKIAFADVESVKENKGMRPLYVVLIVVGGVIGAFIVGGGLRGID